MILKLRTKLKIEELKQKVKSEKASISENFQQMFDRSKKSNPNEVNDISCEKMENLLNNMNIKHPETVANMLNIFKGSKNLNGQN